MEGAQISAGNLARRHLLEQRLRKGRARHQRVDHRRALSRGKLAVAARQLCADLRIIKQSQPAHRRHIQPTHLQQLRADRAEIIRPVVDERLQRRLARSQVCLLIQRCLFHIIQRTPISKQNAQILDDLPVGIRFARRAGKAIPGLRFRRLPYSLERLRHSFKEHPRLLRLCARQQRVQRLRLCRQAARHPLQRLWPGAILCQLHQRHRVLLCQRGNAIPHQIGQEGIIGIVCIPQQRGGQVSSFADRQSLQRAGERQPHKARLLLPRHLHRIKAQLRVNCIRHGPRNRVQGGELRQLADRQRTRMLIGRVQIRLWPGLPPGKRHLRLLCLAVAHAKDAPARAVHTRGLMALARVAPVQDEAAAIRPRADFDAAEPRVITEKHIRLMPAHIAAAVALQPLHIRAAAVHVQREELALVLLWPLLRLVNHHPDVRMPAAQAVRLPIARGRPATAAVVVVVIRDRVELLIHIRVLLA